MTFALYTFKLTKTVYNYGPESEIKKKNSFTVTSLSRVPNGGKELFLSQGRPIQGWKQCLDNLTAHSLLQLLASSLISMETRKIVFFFSISWFEGPKTFQRKPPTPVHDLIPLAVAWSLWPAWIPYVYPKRQWGFWLLYSLNSLLEGDTGWELSWGTFELFFKEAGHSS